MHTDELQLYRGGDYVVNPWMTIHQPTLGEICDYQETRYFSMVSTLTATPTDMRWQLWDKLGLDWNEVTEYELFLRIYSTFSQEETSILFGNLDLPAHRIVINPQNDEPILEHPVTGSRIDRLAYERMAAYLRKVHGFTRNVERAMNEFTRDVLIEEAKENYEMSLKEEKKSFLIPLISTMINFPGFEYNHDTIWDMKISAFMDSIQRMQHIKRAQLFLDSGYSGFGIDLNKHKNKQELNYFADLWK